MQKKAVIIGAGPAGLTAAYELLTRTGIKPVLLEKSDTVGGISKTVNYKGNRLDFGPHRFFSKSDRVMKWWMERMPVNTDALHADTQAGNTDHPKGDTTNYTNYANTQGHEAEEDLVIHYQNKSRNIRQLVSEQTAANGAPPSPQHSLLLIKRLTRIYFLRKFFAYPIQLSLTTLRQLGIGNTIAIVFSYGWARLFPRKPEKSLEDFMINKFGRQLYLTFFKDYTEKVWGVECKNISAEWGAQRIKGISLSKAIVHAAQSITKKKNSLTQKNTETSLIEQFLYPALGAGSLWEQVAEEIVAMGGEIHFNQTVSTIEVRGEGTGEQGTIEQGTRNVEQGREEEGRAAEQRTRDKGEGTGEQGTRNVEQGRKEEGRAVEQRTRDKGEGTGEQGTRNVEQGRKEEGRAAEQRDKGEGTIEQGTRNVEQGREEEGAMVKGQEASEAWPNNRPTINAITGEMRREGTIEQGTRNVEQGREGEGAMGNGEAVMVNGQEARGTWPDNRPITNNEPPTIHFLTAINERTGAVTTYSGDFFFSTMPVQELVAGIETAPPAIQAIAAGLQYRDFINVGVLLRKMTVENLQDNWIYIQEKEVKVARMQIYNNWGPYMVKDPSTTWLGLEYFCNKGDATWNLTDEDLKKLAITELAAMGLTQVEDVLDATVQRMEKTYPAYFGTYTEFDKLQQWISQYENLFLVGRNGMHKYNNADHSMLTAMVAVDNIIAGITSKENIWAINTEQEYHEEKAGGAIVNGQLSMGNPQSAIDPPPSEIEEQENSALHPALPRAAAFDGVSFKNFLLHTPRNRITLWLAAAAMLIQFVVFKYFYPQAGFIYGDSFVYLDTAVYSKDINTYMVGYGHFLRFFSVFTKSDTALVAFQYLALQGSVLYLLFSLFYFYRPARGTQIILLVFMVCNPLFLYLANYVSSDALFVALSMVWFTLLLWITHRPSTRILVWHALVLYVAFTVRYNALIYPFIALIAFGVVKMPLRKKIIGWGAATLLVLSFIVYSGNKYKALTGTWQYSPFSGWQMTNNAMYAYRFIDSADRKPVPPKFQELDNMIRQYFDSTRDVRRYPQEALMASTVYMWDPRLTLYKYRNRLFKRTDSTAGEFKRWASMGPLYKEYGTYLIKQYPLAFLRYFIWPNANKYYAPPVEFLESYNTGKDSFPDIAQAWFDFKSAKAWTRTKNFKVSVLDFYPILTGVINVVLLFSLICFGLLNGFKQRTAVRRGIILGGTVWLVNAGFTIFASSAALRFQSFPILLTTTFALLLIDWLWKAAVNAEVATKPALRTVATPVSI